MPSIAAATAYEPTLTVVRLRACACGCKHPLAFDPPLEQDACPECGATAPAPDCEQTVPVAVAPLLSRALGRLFRRKG